MLEIHTPYSWLKELNRKQARPCNIVFSVS